MTEPINTLIIEQLGEFLSTASKVLPPVDFAELVVDDELSDHHLQAIVAAGTQKLKEREIGSEQVEGE